MMRCIAVDDEPFALQLLADDIGKIPFLQLMKTFSSPLEALEYLKTSSVDLLVPRYSDAFAEGNRVS